jgi:hypothetical protein
MRAGCAGPRLVVQAIHALHNKAPMPFANGCRIYPQPHRNILGPSPRAGCRIEAVQTIGQQLLILDVSRERDIETAFATFVQRGADALLVASGPFLTSQRNGWSRWRRAIGCRRFTGCANSPQPVA